MASSNQSPEKQAISSLMSRYDEIGEAFDAFEVKYVERPGLEDKGIETTRSEIFFRGMGSAIGPHVGAIALYGESPRQNEYRGTKGLLPTKGILIREFSPELGDDFEMAQRLCTSMGVRLQRARTAELLLRPSDEPEKTSFLVSSGLSVVFVPTEDTARRLQAA